MASKLCAIPAVPACAGWILFFRNVVGLGDVVDCEWLAVEMVADCALGQNKRRMDWHIVAPLL